MNVNNQLSERDVRIQKTKTMSQMGVIPYAQSFNKTHFIADIKKQFQDKQHRDINDIIQNPEIQIKTAGRLMLHRSHGKLAFLRLLDSTDQIQLMFHRDNCKIDLSTSQNSAELVELLKTEEGDMSAYKFMEKMIDVGDFIGVRGEVFTTHKGELTIFVSEFKFLSKAIRPLPEKFHGLVDQEELYRKRYLDMTMDPNSYERFLFKSKFYHILREFYHKEGFTEIQTPILGNSASGAAAKPFITYHNVFVRIFFL